MEEILELIIREETRQKFEALSTEDQQYLAERIDNFMRGEIEAHRRGQHHVKKAKDPEAVYDTYLDIGFTNVFTEIAHSYLAVKPTTLGRPKTIREYCANHDIETGELTVSGGSKAVRYINAYRRFGEGKTFDEWFTTFLEPHLKEELAEALTWNTDRDETSITRIIWKTEVKKQYDSLSDQGKNTLILLYSEHPGYLEGALGKRGLNKKQIYRRSPAGEEEKIRRLYETIALCNIIPKIVQSYINLKPASHKGRVPIHSWFKYYDIRTGKRQNGIEEVHTPGNKIYGAYKRDSPNQAFEEWIKKYLPKELITKLEAI